MAKVFLICGKICSGKGFYTRQLKEKEHAVVLSCDEIENDLFHHDLGDRRDAISADIKAYLHKKAVDIARAGCNVILDWGFWSRKERTDVSAYYKNADIDFEWHYIDISDLLFSKLHSYVHQKYLLVLGFLFLIYFQLSLLFVTVMEVRFLFY